MAATSATKVYGVARSQPVRSVELLLSANKIAYELVVINLRDKPKEFTDKFPAGKVPAFEDGDFRLDEGAAILAYIADKHKLDAYYPAALEQRAQVNKWLHWNHNNTRKGTIELIFPTVYGGGSIDDLEDAVDAFHAGPLTALDAHLAGKKFLVGDSVTIADLFILPEVDQFAFTPGLSSVDVSKHANVTRWQKDVTGSLGGDLYARNVAAAIDDLNQVLAADVTDPVRSGQSSQ
jgi:glutathione S-transferase